MIVVSYIDVVQTLIADFDPIILLMMVVVFVRIV